MISFGVCDTKRLRHLTGVYKQSTTKFAAGFKGIGYFGVICERQFEEVSLGHLDHLQEEARCSIRGQGVPVHHYTGTTKFYFDRLLLITHIKHHFSQP